MDNASVAPSGSVDAPRDDDRFDAGRIAAVIAASAVHTQALRELADR